MIHWNFSITSSARWSRSCESWSWALRLSRWARSSRLPARSASPSRLRIWAIRSRRAVEVGRLGLEDRLGRAVGASDADGHRPGSGGAGDDVVGRHEPAEALAELGQDGGAVGVGEPVRLVEDDDRALPLADQGRQRLVLGADQVVVEDEDQQVGPRGQVAGFLLARRPASPISERPGVSVRKTVPSTPSMRVGVVLALLGRPHDGLGLADVSAQQGVDQRRLAGRAGAEDDDVELAAFAAGPELAQLPVQLGPGRLVADLADHALGLLGLDGRGLDHVGRDRGRSSRPARAIRQARRPTQIAPIASRTIRTTRKARPRPRDCRANRSCSSVKRADQPGDQPQRRDREQDRDRRV